MINADEAFSRAEKINTKSSTDELVEIIDMIKDAANKGEFKIEAPLGISENVVRRLRNLGYYVGFPYDDIRDIPSDPNKVEMTISWEKHLKGL